MKKVDSVALSLVSWAQPDRVRKGNGGIGAPRQFVVTGKPDHVGKIDIPTELSCPPVWRAVLGKGVVVFQSVKLRGDSPLFQMAQALRFSGRSHCLAQRRREQSEQQRKDRRHNQNFNQGNAAALARSQNDLAVPGKSHPFLLKIIENFVKKLPQ